MLSVTPPEVFATWLQMDVVHMTCAVGETGDGAEQPGADNVADLDAGVVVAVPEGWQFGNSPITPVFRFEFLRKDGVGDIDVEVFVPTVRDADAQIAGFGQIPKKWAQISCTEDV